MLSKQRIKGLKKVISNFHHTFTCLLGAIIFYGEGGHLSVTGDSHFFLAPLWVPEKILPRLCPHKKVLLLDPQKYCPNLEYLKKFWPPTNRSLPSPLLVKNDSCIRLVLDNQGNNLRGLSKVPRHVTYKGKALKAVFWEVSYIERQL